MTNFVLNKSECSLKSDHTAHIGSSTEEGQTSNAFSFYKFYFYKFNINFGITIEIFLKHLIFYYHNDFIQTIVPLK